jgi:ABC-type Fe3+-hydroxamate transport system substrate-binding protein
VPRAAAPRATSFLLALLWIAGARAAEPAPWPRVVSLNPSLTEILLALDARPALVGVDDYSARASHEVADLPRVGGLFDPSLEAIVALEPDVVALVPSAEQRDLRARLEALGVEVLVLENHTLAQLLASIETLGARVGRAEPARERVAAIRSALADAERAARGRPRVRAVLVLQRDPLFLVGRGSYLDSLLSAAGADNLAAAFPDAYPRIDVEWLIAAAPALILDASEDPEPALTHWQRWPSLPAVATGRVVPLVAAEVTLPGPHLERALAILAEAVAGTRAAAPPTPEAAPRP